MRCVCGCGRRAVQRHHVLYQQHIPPSTRADERNLVALAFDCHASHHLRSRVLPLHVLPDDVFVFAAEVLGPERAYEYLRRRYDGQDIRHERLLLDHADVA